MTSKAKTTSVGNVGSDKPFNPVEYLKNRESFPPPTGSAVIGRKEIEHWTCSTCSHRYLHEPIHETGQEDRCPNCGYWWRCPRCSSLGEEPIDDYICEDCRYG